MTDWLSEAAGLFNTKDFVITGTKTYSYNEVNERAVSLAHLLQKDYKIKEGDIITIISENNIEFILLLFAFWKLGAIPVPINIRLNDSETNNLVSSLKPFVVFISESTNKKIKYGGNEIIRIMKDFVIPIKTGLSETNRIPEKSVSPDLEENSSALILFTSGTSGDPKGVRLSFHNLRTSFNNSNTVLFQNTNDKWIASLPFYHIGGFSIITRTLLSGSAIIIPNSLNTVDLADEIEKNRPTLLSLVSTQMRRFINLGIKPGIELKYVLLGGGYIEPALVDEAIKAGWPICKVYGSTETSSLVTFVDCTKDENMKLSGGKTLANNEIFIVNKNKEVLSYNIKGEIAIKSGSCAMGYFNNPIETTKKFKEGVYYSADVGFIDKEGYLFVDSRMDDLIISGGENIKPLEIERALLKYPGVQNVSVFGQKDEEWGQIVSAAVIIKPGLNISEEELREFLLQKISTYKIPRKFYFLKEFPKGPMGKILKEKLRDMVKDY